VQFARLKDVVGAGRPITIYISGPIMGNEDHATQFRAAAGMLNGLGYLAVDPHDVLACSPMLSVGSDLLEAPICQDAYSSGRVEVAGGHTWECYVKHDLIEMLKCDCLFMLDGWTTSRGAMLEMSTAMSCGIPVFTENGATALVDEDGAWRR
jgi:hypothetical protein